MQNRDDPTRMLGEPSAMEELMYESYKDDPYFRMIAGLMGPGEQYLFENSYHGTTAQELAAHLKCNLDIANGLIINLLALDKIYYCGDEYKKDGVQMYRHNQWVDESESYCPECGSPSHSDHWK